MQEQADLWLFGKFQKAIPLFFFWEFQKNFEFLVWFFIENEFKNLIQKDFIQLDSNNLNFEFKIHIIRKWISINELCRRELWQKKNFFFCFSTCLFCLLWFDGYFFKISKIQKKKFFFPFKQLQFYLYLYLQTLSISQFISFY